MEITPVIQPLPYRRRRYTFFFLALLFLGALPFLYLYATGYRFDLGEETPFISTGGIYVAAERTDASIYVDEKLVRETRAFRKAFYAQGLEPGTHRVHVQKEGHQTWVKELPVYPHLVTEAQAFNLLLVPQVRIISPWKNIAGQSVLFASSTLIASTTNDVVVATSTKTKSLVPDTEFATLRLLFATTTATSTESTHLGGLIGEATTPFSASMTASSTSEIATSTKEWRGVELRKSGDDIFATWIGAREEMPYYYCAEAFELLGTSTPNDLLPDALNLEASVISEAEVIGPVQKVAVDAECTPQIKIDRQWQQVKAFDFYPGSTDLVILARDTGIYVAEIDNRAWQNVQPIFEAPNLNMRVENGNIYVYDGELIYNVLIES